jgi:hypothetical protein
MKQALATFTILLGILSSLHGASRDEMMKCGMWMMSYHLNPSPEEVPYMLSEINRIGLFEPHSRQYPFLGFASKLFQENPEKAEEWIQATDNFDEASKEVIYWSLWLSGVEGSQAILAEKKFSFPSENYFEFSPSEGLERIEEMSIFRPGYLDMNWGQYMASGSREPVIRNLRLFEFYEFMQSPKNEEERMKGELARLALWSTQSNCTTILQFKDLLGEIYEEGVLEQPASSYLGLLLTKVYPEQYYSHTDSDGKTSIYRKPNESHQSGDDNSE